MYSIYNLTKDERQRYVLIVSAKINVPGIFLSYSLFHRIFVEVSSRHCLNLSAPIRAARELSVAAWCC